MALSVFTTPIGTRAAASLHRRFLIGAALGGLAAILLLTVAARTLLERFVDRQGDQMLREAAHRSALVLSDAVEERSRETAVLALTPQVIAAAREGNARSASLKLPGTPVPALEQRFTAEHSLQVSPDARA